MQGSISAFLARGGAESYVDGLTWILTPLLKQKNTSKINSCSLGRITKQKAWCTERLTIQPYFSRLVKDNLFIQWATYWVLCRANDQASSLSNKQSVLFQLFFFFLHVFCHYCIYRNRQKNEYGLWDSNSRHCDNCQLTRCALPHRVAILKFEIIHHW